MYRESHSRQAGSYSNKSKKKKVIRCLASREPPQRRRAWRPLTPVRVGASCAGGPRLVTRWISAVNCFLVDRQNLVQAVNGQLLLCMKKAAERIVWSCATKQWKGKKPLLAHLLPDYGSLDDFFHSSFFFLTGGVSMRRCGVDAMRTSSECDVRGPELDDPRGLGFLLLDDLQGCHRSRSRLCLVFAGLRALDVVSLSLFMLSAARAL